MSDRDEQEALVLINKDKPVMQVRHADLTRSSGNSPYRSVCPVCTLGTLLVCRDQRTGELRADDWCILCGQRFEYTDIDDLRRRLG